MPADQATMERALGAAVVRMWGQLPREIQERLFEQAVSVSATPGDDLREHLAVFLHHKHPRTDHHAS
jgi:hypothetical protein